MIARMQRMTAALHEDRWAVIAEGGVPGPTIVNGGSGGNGARPAGPAPDKAPLAVFLALPDLPAARGFRLALLVAGLLVVFVRPRLLQNAVLLKLLLEALQRGVK